jgi:hypothetical protein
VTVDEFNEFADRQPPGICPVIMLLDGRMGLIPHLDGAVALVDAYRENEHAELRIDLANIVAHPLYGGLRELMPPKGRRTLAHESIMQRRRHPNPLSFRPIR